MSYANFRLIIVGPISPSIGVKFAGERFVWFLRPRHCWLEIISLNPELMSNKTKNNKYKPLLFTVICTSVCWYTLDKTYEDYLFPLLWDGSVICNGLEKSVLQDRKIFLDLCGTSKCYFTLGYICMIMMTSSNGNIFRVTGHLCGEFTGHRWIPRTKASDAELWCFLWSAPE